jgi:hypothetical protein
MRRWLLALTLLAAAARLAAVEPVAAIDACVRQLDRELDVGYARVAQHCPDLAASLSGSSIAPWLPRDWNKTGNNLSADSLTELRTLLSRPAPAETVRAPRVAGLAAVLATLRVSEPPHGGWWARFKDWLRELVSPRRQDPDSGWLRRLFGSIDLSQSALHAMSWLALAAVIVLAIGIVANELRVAGLLGRARPRRVPGAPAPGADAQTPLASAHSQDQPRRLLDLIIARLNEQQRLPPARALTLQELVRAARLPQPVDRERLGSLAAICEALRFAASEVPAPRLAAAVTDGTELLSELQRQRPPAPGAGN